MIIDNYTETLLNNSNVLIFHIQIFKMHIDPTYMHIHIHIFSEVALVRNDIRKFVLLEHDQKLSFIPIKVAEPIQFLIEFNLSCEPL